MKRRIKLTATKVYGRFMGFIAGVQKKVAQDLIENLQKSAFRRARKRNGTLHCEVLSGIKGENLGRKT